MRLEESVEQVQARGAGGSDAKRLTGLRALRALEEGLIKLENWVFKKLQVCVCGMGGGAWVHGVGHACMCWRRGRCGRWRRG